MAELNTEQLHSMEDEFLKLQNIELAIDSDRSKASKVISGYAASVKTYTDRKKLDKLISEAESIIAGIAKTGQVRGRVMSLKTMEKYLEESERVSRGQRLLDIIARQNKKRAQQRLSLYIDELLKEKGVMVADINLFRKRGKIAGLSLKEVNKRLAQSSLNKASPVDAFGKRLKTLEKSVLRREASATEIDEYKKSAKPDESWQWITISGGPCPDCKIRAGVVMKLSDWEKRGLPGSGSTICRSSCMCKLIPASIADDLFPDVKTFKWDKGSGVLTTFGDMRSFGAKKNKPVIKYRTTSSEFISGSSKMNPKEFFKEVEKGFGSSSNLQEAIDKGYIDKYSTEEVRKSIEEKMNIFGYDGYPGSINIYNKTDNVMAYATSYEEVYLNNRYFVDSKSFKEVLRYNVKTGYHPIGCDTIKSVVDHEMAHILQFKLKMTDNELNKIIFDELKIDKNKLASGLSKYSTVNVKECMAEAFAEYFNSNNPREISVKITEYFIKKFGVNDG